MNRRGFLQLSAGLAALAAIPAPILKQVQKVAEINAYEIYERHQKMLAEYFRELRDRQIREALLEDYSCTI